MSERDGDGHEFETLVAQAEAGMSADAPASNALAREKLLQFYREDLAPLYVPIEELMRMRGDRNTPEWHSHRAIVLRKFGAGWCEADFRTLEWICRLEVTGHIGAANLLDRLFLTGYSSLGIEASLSAKELAQSKKVQMLGRTFPKVAQFLAVMEVAKPKPSLDALLAWLDLGGALHTSLAFGIREVRNSSLPVGSRAMATILHHVHWAKETAKGRSAGAERVPSADLLLAFATGFLPPYHHPTAGEREEAVRLVELAAELGSENARVELWFERYRSAPDKDVHLRDWLSTILQPRSVDDPRAQAHASPISVAVEFIQISDPDRAMLIAKELLDHENGDMQAEARRVLGLIRRLA